MLFVINLYFFYKFRKIDGEAKTLENRSEGRCLSGHEKGKSSRFLSTEKEEEKIKTEKEINCCWRCVEKMASKKIIVLLLIVIILIVSIKLGIVVIALLLGSLNIVVLPFCH